MAFVINVIKWLLWTVETIYYSVLEPRRCAKHNVACQHSQQTRDVDPMLAHRL